MGRDFKHIIFILVLIFSFSFLFNFTWESFHAGFYYEGHNILANQYVPMMTFVSIIDAVVILGIYVLLSVIYKDLFWIKELNRSKGMGMITAGLVIAYLIEYVALQFHWWSYNPSMPTFLGVGISPLIQLSTTGILAVIVAKMLIYR